MSGTAALAAARKRRATPGQNGNVQNVQNGNGNLQPVREEFEPPKQMNPGMLLMQHNVNINKLQQELVKVQQELTSLKSNTSANVPLQDNYKSEYLGLLEEMKEMKKVLLKVQTFSMETNLEVMKLKRTVTNSNTNEANQVNLSSITINNDLDEIIKS